MTSGNFVSLFRAAWSGIRHAPDANGLVPMIRAVGTAAMPASLLIGEGRMAYRKRKWIAEPSGGWIKNVLRFRQFSPPGLHRVRAEWKLACMALNLRRVAVLSAG